MNGSAQHDTRHDALIRNAFSSFCFCDWDTCRATTGTQCNNAMQCAPVCVTWRFCARRTIKCDSRPSSTWGRGVLRLGGYAAYPFTRATPPGRLPMPPARLPPFPPRLIAPGTPHPLDFSGFPVLGQQQHEALAHHMRGRGLPRNGGGSGWRHIPGGGGHSRR